MDTKQCHIWERWIECSAPYTDCCIIGVIIGCRALSKLLKYFSFNGTIRLCIIWDNGDDKYGSFKNFQDTSKCSDNVAGRLQSACAYQDTAAL
jgi:hypothetical protein